jgi:deoxyribodipyrimidine photo-lyase
MQQSQRVSYNHALIYAIERANELRQPLVVFFALSASFPEANLRHYAFMLEGLAQTEQLLYERGIRLLVQAVEPEQGIVHLAKRASLVVTDRGYLRIQRKWRAITATQLSCPLVQVETDVIVPVEVASGKEAYGAATIRSKLHQRRDEFFTGETVPTVQKDSLAFGEKKLDLSDISKLCSSLPLDTSVAPVTWIKAGERAAQEMLERFIAEKLEYFAHKRNDPGQDYLSNLSPYLHFGQISPYDIAKRALESGLPSTSAFIEELFVRRELAMNFVFYNDRYDSIACLPDWCQQTLMAHQADGRDYVYTPEQLEQAQTHDPYWNAAQKELLVRGKMHGYMRMYWGKKILEWSPTPAIAFATALSLNNKYNLDGRDPNGFAGVAWCFGKHDRPWSERKIFGKIRYMNDKGLERKFDIAAYVGRIEHEWKNSDYPQTSDRT